LQVFSFFEREFALLFAKIFPFLGGRPLEGAGGVDKKTSIFFKNFAKTY